jgi:hypothetical protein
MKSKVLIISLMITVCVLWGALNLTVFSVTTRRGRNITKVVSIFESDFSPYFHAPLKNKPTEFLILVTLGKEVIFASSNQSQFLEKRYINVKLN